MMLQQRMLWLFLGWFISCNALAAGEQQPLTLKLNTLENYITKEQIATFEKMATKKYSRPVKVILTPAFDPADAFTGFRSKSQDVAMVPHHILKDERFHFIDKKLALPIRKELVPNLADVNKDMLDLDFFKVGDQLYSVPYATGPYGLLMNLTADKKLKSKVTSWSILWDPTFKKKYSTTFDYYECNIYLTAMALGRRGKDMYDFDSLKDDKVFLAKLAELAKNADHLWIGYEDIQRNKPLLLSAGWGFERMNAKAKLNQTWEFASLKEGVTGWVDSHAIGAHVASDETLLKVAHDMVNFLISPELQAANVVKTMAVYPANTGKGLRGQLKPQEIAQARLDDPGFFKREQILFPVLNNRQRKGVEKLWRDALTTAQLTELLPKLKSK